MTTRRLIAHPAHRPGPGGGSTPPAWVEAIRREVVAAYRRGSMSADRCLRTCRLQGGSTLLPPVARAFLAEQATIERRSQGASGPVTLAETLGEHGERDLAAIFEGDVDRFARLIEAGRLYFFPAASILG